MPGREELLRRIQLGEDSTLELRRVVLRSAHHVAAPHPDSLADELAAMANASGGIVVLGVDDASHEILGVPLEELDTVEAWVGAICRDKITPPLDMETRHVDLPGSDGLPRPVIVINVSRSLWVHRSPGGYYRRVGHSKREMAPEMLARLFQQRGQTRLIRFEEQPVPGTTLDDIDPLLARVFLRPGEREIEAQLKRLHLLVPDGDYLRVSVAGVLLATTKPVRWLPSAYIQAVAYTGVENDPAEQRDAKDFDGPLGHQIWDAYDFVYRNMRVGAEKSLGRIDRPEYSMRAVFEALVNAVAHRDYSMSNARIRLHLFSDRMELSSPGALPNSLSIESMREVSVPRNELIASLFARYFPTREGGLGREYLMDRRGAGVDVILRESEKLAGRRPLYESHSDVELRLTIWAAAQPG